MDIVKCEDFSEASRYKYQYGYWGRDGDLIFHREDGPAVELKTGTQYWYNHGKLHRIDGPAVVYPTGDQIWVVNDKRHRKDGPAVIWADGRQEWWFEGLFVEVSSQEEFEKWLKYKNF